MTQPNELYNILINGREVGTIRIADVKEYMDKLWPGVSYSVSEDGKTVDITATVVQLMELRDKRQEAFSKR
ncbi:hypothetical protein ACF3MZ_21360 [Paenibacillaceae bacterium WGS1546]|uniref:hypothetical protein n=1 Tax=Cohnella sp. WGS1546 TaxID=3366810 RepID=UPI00372D0587